MVAKYSEIWLAALVTASMATYPAQSYAQGFDRGVFAYRLGLYQAALREWKPLAENGDVRAQYMLGYMFDFGEGVSEDDEKALRWYHLAAEQGDANAQFNIGMIYDFGVTDESRGGIHENDTEAVLWYLRAAQQGQVDAQYYLGLRYLGGEGVDRDVAESVRWHRKAAAQGHVSAQYSLGMAYSYTAGFSADLKISYMWFQLAATNGVQTQEILEELAAEMTETEVYEAINRANVCLASNYRNCD